ncbi:nucleoside hydrolase [Myxococcota bacterium]|nr:nucleoside hydrolase [Myxococcota bacterium]
MRVWIDTDVGTDVDDALAIAYALRHPSIDLVGISTVFGDVSLRSRIANRILELAGASEVPVVEGLGAPLSPKRKGRMFGHEGLGILVDPAPRKVVESNDDASERVEALARELAAKRPDALVAIGPATNLGALARAGHPLPPLTIMGGKIENVLLPGMIDSIPEWNWWCDPLAIDDALRAPQASPPRIIPAEVTFRTHLESQDVAKLAAGSPLTAQLAVLCDHWLEVQREGLGAKIPTVHLHDPLAIATLSEPNLAPLSTRNIRVDSRGHTHQEPEGTPVAVATHVDNDALRAHLLEIWLG